MSGERHADGEAPRAPVTAAGSAPAGGGLSPITLDRIDPDAIKVVRRLNRHGFEAYLVGGCVRDLLLGRTPKDFDVSTNATPEQIRRLFRNCRIIGRRFRLAHIFFGPKIIETATFRADPRKDASPEGEDLLIRRDNVYGTAEEDARRRDFTINGLFFDIERREVIDWVNGLPDIEARVVRTIGDPSIRFKEDPVRILRAVKFAARLGLTIEAKTARAAIQERQLVSRCAVARVLEEIYRLLGSGAAADAFRLLHELGVLPVLFPELRGVVGDPEDPDASGPVVSIQAPHARRLLRANDAGEPRDRRDDGAGAEESDGAGDDASRDGARRRRGRRPPPAPPPIPTPEEVARRAREERDRVEMLLSAIGLRDASRRETAAAAIWTHLAALDDHVRAAGAPPSHALLLGALLAPLAAGAIDPSIRMAETVARVDRLVDAVAIRLQLSRRDRERLRQLFVAQRRLERGGGRSKIVRREHFPDALALLEIRAAATGDPALAKAAERWRAAAAGDESDGASDRDRPPRRRRRRGGRGRRRKA